VDTIMLGKVRDALVDYASEFVGLGGPGQTAKIRWKHRAPMHTDVPRTSLVGEKDHVILRQIDVPKQSEEELERLPHRSLRPDVDVTNASGHEPIELGNERVGPFGLLRAIPTADWETLVVPPGEAGRVETADLTEQRRRRCTALRQDVDLDQVAQQREQFCVRQCLNGALSDDEELTTAQVLK